MAMNEIEDLETPSDNINQPSNSIVSTNPNAPKFIKEALDNNSKNEMGVSVDYNINNPYDVTLPGGFYSSSSLEGIQDKPSFLESAAAQAYKMNYTAQGLDALSSEFEKTDPLFYEKPDGWTPKSNIDKFVNVRQEYMGALLDAKSPKHQQYLLQKIYEEQKLDDDVANGSWLSWLVGGAVGIASDPMTYIPVASWVKYGKISSSFVASAAKSLAGGGTYGVLSSAAEQMDKVNGNLHDFVVDSFVKTAFSTVLFGSLGAGASLSERMGLWEANKLAKAYVDGAEFKFETDEAGEISGYKMHITGEPLNAMKVSYMKEIADSQFYKSGVFKIPYVGTGIMKIAGMPVFGSPLINLVNSKSPVVRAVIDRVADHNFITKGVAEGKAAPQKFASLMNREFAKIRALSVQYDALFYERNGIEIKNRIAASTVETALYLKDKGAKLLGEQLDKSGYISREQFNDEVQQAIHSNEPSEHNSVNEAASMIRKQKDITYKAYRSAYNLPENWLPPKTAEAFLTRVYDTPYMNVNKGKWIGTISNWLKESDDIISAKMQPIRDLEQKIKAFKELDNKNINSNYNNMKIELNSLKDKLQNELRTNPDLQLHVDDWNALSSDESKELKALLQPTNELKKQIDGQKKVISDLSKKKSVKISPENKKVTIDAEKEKLRDLEDKHFNEISSLQERAYSGEINQRFWKKKPDSNEIEFKNPDDRLRFRDEYESHSAREDHAKAYYDTILNQTPEDTINQVMGRFTGNQRENPLKSRTLLIPDQVLYDGKFMTNDVMAKTSNYTTYLARRTHLKNVFSDVSIEGGFEPVLAELATEHDKAHTFLSNRKSDLENKLKEKDLSAKEIKDINKQIKNVDKELVNTRKDLDKNREVLNILYDKMMGIQKTSRRAMQIKSSIMSITAWANLPFVPLTQINDLSAIGLQHGMWAFIRDGLYPIVESLGGVLKTKDSEALRKAAPSVHLGIQDAQMAYADRNWGMHNNPYLNLGRFVNTLEKISYVSANFTGTNYIDNFLQHITGSVVQSELMRILHASKLGKLSKRDGNYIRKYGIDPEIWRDRMLAAFEKNGGGKTRLGGYQSHFWQWEDMEASNVFSDAVFRSIKDTQISAGIADAPLFLDDNGPIGIMGSFLRGFNGWAFASVNRYVIPSLQQADGEKLIGVMAMLGTGYLVDPMRRVARSEEMFPENITDKQIMWATFNNSGYFSFFANIMANANLISGGNLLGDLKSDKYKNRTRAGLLGPAWGTVNRMADIVSALASNEMNEADAKKMARMIPFANASWTSWMSNALVEGLELPKNRSEAHALKEAS